MPYDIEGRALYPLTNLLTQGDFPLSEVIPEAALAEIFGSLYYTSAESFFADDTAHINLELVAEGDLALTPPGLPGVSLVAASGGDGWLSFDTSFRLGAEPSATLRDVPLALRIDRGLLQPMLSPTEVDTSKAGVEIQLGDISLTADTEGLTLDADIAVDLPLSMIGETGVLIEASGVTVHFDGHHPAPGRPEDWRGIFIDHASLRLPGDLGAALGLLEVDDAYLGSGGFTGAISSTWTPPQQVTLGGFQFELGRVEIEFAQNALVRGEIAGRVTVPFFDSPLDVVIALGLDGSFNVAIGSQSGIVEFIRPGVLSLSVDSVRLGLRDEVFTIGLSGELAPLVAGFDWPTFRIQELSIDSQGNVGIEGGWLDLREQYALSFSGFSLEISKIGFGSTSDRRRWIGFSGGLKLVDGITGGASVEGLRLIWNPANNDVDVTLNGIGVEFDVPGAVYFKGAVMSPPLSLPPERLSFQSRGSA